MERKYLMGITAAFLVAVLGAGIVSAFGFGHGIPGFGMESQNMTEMQEEADAIQSAIENEDYDTWKSLMEDRIARMQEQLTEQNFNQIVEMHQQMSEMQKVMKEARDEFCEENECPMGEGEGPSFRGPFDGRGKPSPVE